MKASLLICGLLVSLAVLGPAGLLGQEIIKSFEAPWGYSSYGLTWDGQDLWCGDDSDGSIARVDTSDGHVITTILGAPQSNHGLAWDSTHLWVSGDYHTDWIYRIAPNGDRVDSIVNPGGDYSGGMTWDGEYLWVTRYYPNTQPNLFKVDVSDGSIKDTIPSQGLQPQGLAWDGVYLWNVQDDNDGDPEKVWQLDPATGDTLHSFAVPNTGSASGESPRGLAWDGKFLWLVSRGPDAPSTKYIYQIDPFGGGIPDISLWADEHDYGHTVIGVGRVWSLGITNDGTADLVVDSVSCTDGHFTYTATFPEIIVPGGDFVFDVTFSPDTWGSFGGTLTVYSNDPLGDPPTVALIGWGVWPTQEIGPVTASHDYGLIRVNADKRWLLTIQNEGATALWVYSVTASSGNFEVREVEFSVEIDSAMTFDLPVWFHPTDAVTYSDTLTIITNDTDEPVVTVAISGLGDGSSYPEGTILWSHQVVGGYSSEVTSIRSIPDINGDGFDDCIATAEDYHTYCINGNGSGEADILWSFDTSVDLMRTGSVWQDFAMTPVPDLNSDGRYDVVIGTAGGSRSVFALAGTDGDVIWSYDSHEYGGGGWIDEVTGQDDIDGDGVGDVLAAAEDDGSDTGPRRAYCLSGATGAKIWDRLLSASVFCVRAIDDVTGDGKNEVAAGTTAGLVHILNGATGAPIDSYDAGSTVWTVAAIEDITGDGRRDIIAGTHDGYVHAIRSDSASLAWSAPTSVGNIITEVHVIGDQNGDGIGDITVAGVMTNYLLLDGAGGGYLWSRSSGQMAFATSRVPDLSGDGLEDVIGGSGYNVNRVVVMEGTSGDTLWMRSTAGPVETVSFIESIDGDSSSEILVGTRSGEILCLAGGGGVAGVIDAGEHVAYQPVRVWNEPNPFGAETSIRYRMGRSGRATLAVFDVRGRCVKTLINGPVTAGESSITWDGCNESGTPVNAGIYFVCLKRGAETTTRKIVLAR
ncbi:MAG: choice-of-anchor D domain-containing protein [Candidatus Eisenbacteria bacterium]